MYNKFIASNLTYFIEVVKISHILMVKDLENLNPFNAMKRYRRFG